MWGGHKAKCCVSSEWGDGKNALSPDWAAPLVFVTCMFVCLWVDGRALKAWLISELGHFTKKNLVFHTWRLQTLQVGTYVEIESESIHAFMCAQGQRTDMDSTRTSFYLIWIVSMDPTKVCVCICVCVFPEMWASYHRLQLHRFSLW